MYKNCPKKRLLFILPSYGIGGTIVSTRTLIGILDKNKYDISVWALHNDGLLKGMYNGIETIPTCFTAYVLALDSWHLVEKWYGRLAAAILRIAAKKHWIQKILYRHSVKKCLRGYYYDTVIACQEGLTTSFAAEIPCANHVAWVRCDYKQRFVSRGEQCEPVYNRFNHIVCVSEKTRINFVDIYPKYAKRTVCIYNPQDSEFILAQSKFNDNDALFRINCGKVIVSMGRLDRVKRFAEIPLIARYLVERGLSFRWYIIGEGSERRPISDAIANYGVEEYVILLGAKSNPHFYIRWADLYVCLSTSEACPRVINEAKILGTPVVSTDFPTVYEYLEDGKNGRIVPIEKVGETIMEMFTNNMLYSRIKKEIEHFSFDNTPLVAKLEEIL